MVLYSWPCHNCVVFVLIARVKYYNLSAGIVQRPGVLVLGIRGISISEYNLESILRLVNMLLALFLNDWDPSQGPLIPAHSFED